MSQSEDVCLTTFKKHWSEAQIDSPMQIVARYDDVAKLLITIGGFALAALAAMVRELSGVMSSRTRMASAIAFGSMLVFFVCAALTCYWSPKMWAAEILNCPNDQALQCFMKQWCENISRVIKIKKVLIGLATGFFILSFLLMMLILMRLL